MNTDKKVLACVDRSHFSGFVADYAIWAARRLKSPLKFLHVIENHPEIGSGEDHSGAIGFNAQEALLTKLSEQDAAKARTAHENGRIFLNSLRERAVAGGIVAPDMKQRHGELEETLVALEDEVELFVWGRRGESSEAAQRNLGRNVERVVRALHKPILSVTESFSEPRHVMIAFDGGSLTRKGIELIAASRLFAGLTVNVLMSGRESQDSPKHMAWAQEKLAAAGLEAVPLLIPGEPGSVIARTIPERNIDLLVMGAYAHSPLRSLVFGCKTNDMLRATRIPALLLR
ncbi:MAG: universal stress protein [Gammaproteobacteria bacterium]|nr:universal stress protein [Gammaproteobacteria bacterium]MBU1646243.1 universal stress protein [Gammaproteobacteria bacterium]MBU1970749.1 universal stress protein [Gammaproteobacteria bacterium]